MDHAALVAVIVVVVVVVVVVLVKERLIDRLIDRYLKRCGAYSLASPCTRPPVFRHRARLRLESISRSARWSSSPAVVREAKGEDR